MNNVETWRAITEQYYREKTKESRNMKKVQLDSLLKKKGNLHLDQECSHNGSF